MQFMMMINTAESDGPPSPALRAAVGQLMAEMAGSGKLVSAGGLMPAAFGARLDLAQANVTVADGPFDAPFGGFAILDALSKDEAVQLGRRFLEAHAGAMGASYEASLEIRQLAE